MKYILIDSNSSLKNMKRVIPVGKNQKLNLANRFALEKKLNEAQNKAKTNYKTRVRDAEFNKELKEQTAVVLTGFMRSDIPIRLTAVGLENELSAAVERAIVIQEREKKEKKKLRVQKFRKIKGKIFRRRKDG